MTKPKPTKVAQAVANKKGGAMKRTARRKTLFAFKKLPPGPEFSTAEKESADEQVIDFGKLQERYKLRRQAFVREYVKDFNGVAAIGRIGLKYAYPAVRAHEWLQEPYTQMLIQEYTEKVEEKSIVTRNTVLLGLLREANAYGKDASSASRVSAFKAMAKVLGMEITKIEGNVTVGGGVMTVPFAGTLEDWEKRSAEQQEKLKAEVRK